MAFGPWLFLEPYYGGSHRYLVDGLVSRLPFEVRLWTLPARKWKWRMRGAALHFAERFEREQPDVVGIFTTSLLDVAALRGLLPARARQLPLLLYCHENQLRYPVQVEDKRDFHFAWTNIQSVAAADRVLWNSAWNRDSFLNELPVFLARMPDAQPVGLAKRIADRSGILPVPLDSADLAASSRQIAQREGPCRILWNHRWEHDKQPEQFFSSLYELADGGFDFELSVLGQSFSDLPPVFAQAREKLAGKIRAWGFLPGRQSYLEELSRSDLVVSTAAHEFQGLAVLEAAACGAVPLVPDRLSYPEIWPKACLYQEGELTEALANRIERLDEVRRTDLRETPLRFDWSRLAPDWEKVFRDVTP